MIALIVCCLMIYFAIGARAALVLAETDVEFDRIIRMVLFWPAVFFGAKF